MPPAFNTKLVAVMGADCVIDPVPVKVTVVPLIGELIAILLGSILRDPPALIGLLIVMLLPARVLKLTAPEVVKPDTVLALPTTKSALFINDIEPTPDAEIKPIALAALLSVKLPPNKVNQKLFAFIKPDTVIVPAPPNTASPPSVTDPV